MTRMLVAALVVLAAVSFPGVGIPQTADAPAQLTGVKVTEHPQSLMVGLETSGPVRSHLSRQDPPGPDAPKAVAQAAPPGGAPAPAAPARQPQPQTAPEGGKLITIDFKDADVINVIRLLGTEGGRNIVVGEDVKGKVSVSLRNVTWEQALETILEARALQKIEKDGIIRIVSREQLAKEREALAKAEEAKLKAEIEVRTKIAEAELKEQQVQQRKLSVEAAAAEAQARGPLKEAVLRLAYADPGEVANTLQGVLGLGAQPIEPCIRISEGERETRVEFRTGGGGVTSGPIAEPPFSQLFGPPRTPEQTPPPLVPPEVLARGLAIR